MVKLRRGPEAIQTALRLVLFIDTKQVGGIVPQEVGRDAHGTLDRGRKGNQIGKKLRLSLHVLLMLGGHNGNQSAVFVQT